MANRCSRRGGGNLLDGLCGAGSIILDRTWSGALGSTGIGIAFGIGVFTAIYLFVRISGAHINPAVTFALTMLGRFPTTMVAPYWFAQLLGATAAAICLTVIPGVSGDVGPTLPSNSAAESLFVEVAITFTLVIVIAVVGTDRRLSRTTIATIIGSTVAVMATIGGPISGASMNPARSFGPGIVSGVFTQHWIYWLGPLLGSSIAALTFRTIAHRIRFRCR